MAGNRLLAAALKYAAAGIPVFPLRPRDKKPATKDGFKSATTDAEQIKALWAAQPKANVGGVPPEGVFVLDLDGPEALAVCRANGWELPTTMAVETGGGGLHLYYRTNGQEVRQTAGELGPGIDTRVHGKGYVVLPPSVHPDTGKRYRWKSKDHGLEALVDAPAWLLEALAPGAAVLDFQEGKERRVDVDEIFAGVPVGKRNDALFRYGCRLRAQGRAEGEIETLVLEAARRAKPPLPTKEAQGVVASALKYAPGEVHRRFRLSDTGNAQRFAAMHGAEVRYCHPWARWLVWTGERWERDERGAAVELAKDVVTSLYRDVGLAAEDEMREKFAKHAARTDNAHRIKNMLELARSEPGIPVTPEAFDTNPFLLNLENGTLDLRTGTLRQHRRSDLITKLAPVAYDADAVAPAWSAFLERVFNGNAELIKFLQRFAGYTLTADTGERCMAILHGTGDNGKSTFAETLLEMLGDYAATTATETLLMRYNDGAIPNDVAALQGARLVVAAESEQGRRLAESRVKQMTGGDTMAARFMRAEWFQFKPVFKLLLSTNHRPEIRGTDHAIWRRIRLVPFNVRIPEAEQDKRLKEKLKAEWPGILAWAVRGCLEWQKNGLQTPDSVNQATSAYRLEQDVLGQFLEDRCAIGEGCQDSARELFKAYQSWCTDTGEKTVSQRRFGDGLRERGFEKGRGKGGRVVWFGLATV